MSTLITTNSPVSVADARGAETLRPSGKAATVKESQTALNAAIVQASLDVSLSTKNEPLALLLKTAIDGINAALEPELGANAIQNAMGQDNSPEGTAGRIVSLSTGLYEAFKSQHSGEDEASVLQKFMTTIRGGFEQGFKEASDILQGLGVLNGDLASGIDKTYALVQQGYADFEAAQNERIRGTGVQQAA